MTASTIIEGAVLPVCSTRSAASPSRWSRYCSACSRSCTSINSSALGSQVRGGARRQLRDKLSGRVFEILEGHDHPADRRCPEGCRLRRPVHLQQCCYNRRRCSRLQSRCSTGWRTTPIRTSLARSAIRPPPGSRPISQASRRSALIFRTRPRSTR